MLKKLPIFILLFLFTLFPILPQITNAWMQIPSIEITEDTTWTVANSPYYFTEMINIHPGATLTIEPGVIVKLEYATINVDGQLIANGSQDNPIIFTSNSGGQQEWTMMVWPGGKVNLNYVTIQRGGYYETYNEVDYYTGAIAINGGEVNINNSTISNNKAAISNQSEEAQINIHNTTIDNNYLVAIANYAQNQIDATNNWWGDDTGPYHSTLNPQGQGDKIIGNVLFDPWIGKQQKKTPVIIVPGIMGSYLNKNDVDKTEVWPNVVKSLADPWDNHLNELSMELSGYPDINNSSLLPTEIFREMYNRDFFYGLIEELKSNGYKENEDLFVFPYDWRYFIEWSANEGDPFPLVKSLKEKIEEVKNQTNSEKVNIIAHSMGGLLAKYYLLHNGATVIDKFIDIGTPHLGSPKVFKTLMYGDDLGFRFTGISILNPTTIHSISQNIPSLYELLPSRNYFNELDNDYAYYIYDMHDLDNNGVKGRLNYDESIEFMKNTGRNNYLLGFNDSLHNALDNYSPPSEGVSTYNIIGCGRPTLGQIFVLNKEESGKYEYGIKYINGDGTVPLKSAEAITANKTYYANGMEHAYLPSSDGIKELIATILQGEENLFDFSGHPNIREDKNNCASNGTQISFHSPIKMHIYDESSNHLGPNEDGDIESEIEGAAYDDIDGNKFAFLPKGHNYRIVGNAESEGSFNLRIQNVNNGEYNQTVYFNEIPLASSSTNVELEINDNGQNNYLLNIDQEGDSIFESQIEPDSILNQEESSDLDPPETAITINGRKEDDNIFTSEVEIILNARDNKNGSGILKAEYNINNNTEWSIYGEPIRISAKGEYTILYKSIDRAGNVEEAKKAEFSLIATIDSTIQDIKISYNNGHIIKRQIRDSLIRQLQWIKMFNSRFKETEIGKKIIRKQYEILLRELDLYHRLGWINEQAYNIIKEDLIYLRNNP